MEISGKGCLLSGRLRLAGILLLASSASAAAIGRGPEPIARIELEPMGYQGLQQEHMVAGSPMLTVNFVDDNHLLVTFEVRRLMKRETNAGPGEADRTVMACLVDVASDTVVAHTEWRLHDRSQYLWDLGGGKFLLRIRDELTVFSPMAGKPEDAFRTSPFLQTQRHIVAVLLSADRDLLTIESVKRPDATAGDVAVHVGVDPAPVQINFYRLRTDETDHNKLVLTSAGAIRTRAAIALPVTAAGYLDIIEGGKRTWLFNFDEHSGKVHELLAFDTTCFPRPVFVGHDEFIVFGCKSGDERRLLAGFNLRGEEMWQQGFYESYIAPTFSFAPAAGRFALGRTIIGAPLPEDVALSAAAISSQEVRVYQTYNGTQLFRINCTPVERSGQNFDLSPDGMRLAVVRETEVRRKGTKVAGSYMDKSAGIEIYALPPLTDQDRSSVKAAAINAPADTGVPIDEALARVAASKSKEAKSGVGTIAPAASAPAAASDASNSGENQAANADTAGDQQEAGAASVNQEAPTEPRKPPTLYGPDEKPQDKQNK
jgi:hypothetical protein